MSDGSKCDIGRMQMMFGAQTTVAVQVRVTPGIVTKQGRVLPIAPGMSEALWTENTFSRAHCGSRGVLCSASLLNPKVTPHRMIVCVSAALDISRQHISGEASLCRIRRTRCTWTRRSSWG